MVNLIDELFKTLAKQLVNIHEKGLYRCDNFTTGNKAVDDFLKFAVDISKEGLEPKIVDSELSFYISKHILNKDINEVELHSMEIIKGSLPAIVSEDYEFIVSYSKYLCSYETAHEIWFDIFHEFSTVEPMSIEELRAKMENCESGFIDIIPRKGGVVVIDSEQDS